LQKVTSLFIILGALIVVMWLWSVIKFIAMMLLPFALFAGAIYVIGYFTPKPFHDAFQANVKSGLDWLQFKLPPKAWWPIKCARNALDWLGLNVKPAS